MITQLAPETFNALYAPIASSGSLEEKVINLGAEPTFRNIDGDDPRNLLLNVLDTTHRNLQALNPRLVGLQIGKAFTTVNGSPRVTYTVAFTYKDTRGNILLDEPTLEALIPAPVPNVEF